MPVLSPSASRSVWPSTMPTSSTVWWMSTSTSPVASTARSIRPCLAHASSMWLKNGIGVCTLELPVPSRFSCTATSVSLVLRSTLACRPSPLIRGPPCSELGRLPVAGESLHACQRAQVRQRRREPGRRVLDDARALDVVLGPQPPGEPPGARRRQLEVVARDAVADDL